MIPGKGYKQAKREVIAALLAGDYQHEARGNIECKNKLATGEVTAEFVIDIIMRSRGSHHSCSSHHFEKPIDVHVIASGGWYVKLYFLDPDTWFISVHR